MLQIAYNTPAAVKSAEYVIFCVGQHPAKVTEFHKDAACLGLDYKPLIGSYKGEVEASFIVHADEYKTILPYIQNEESVLLLGAANKLNNRPAWLFYPDSGEDTELGEFKDVPQSFAEAQDAWTYDIQSGNYFVAA